MESTEVDSAVVAAWYDDSRVYLIERRGDVRNIRLASARWSLFVRAGSRSADALEAVGTRRGLVVPEGGVETSNGFMRFDFTATRSNRGTFSARRNRDSAVAALLRAGFTRDSIRESDVDPVKRLFADDPSIVVARGARICFIDLESQSPGQSIDDARAGRSRILSYAARGVEGTKRSDVLLRNETREIDSIPVSEVDTAERVMISELLEFLAQYDVIVAWFGGGDREGAGFDFDCLRNRCSVLGVSPSSALRDPRARWEMWAWLDHMEVYKKYASGDGDAKSSLGLNHVAQSLGIGSKVAFDAGAVYEVWASGPEGREAVLEYNVQDTDLLPGIEAETGFLALQLGICQLCNLIPHTRSLRATAIADGYLLRFGAANAWRWPSNWWESSPGATRDEDDADTIAFQGKAPGAYVFDPRVTGILQDVVVADYAGLYPSIMRSWGIGPDTVVSESEYPGLYASGVPMTRAPDVPVWFRKDTKSLFTTALETMVSNRKTYQDEAAKYVPGSDEYKIYSNLSTAAKIIANSFYGVLLCQYWRYYSYDAGRAVTTTAKWLLLYAADSAESAGYRVVYGDTDSVFVMLESSPITPRGQTELYTDSGNAFKAWVDAINAGWGKLLGGYGCEESYVRLEWEKAYARLIMGGEKKRYVGAMSLYKAKRPKTPWKHDVKGLAMRRGDRLRLARVMQSELVDMLIGAETDPELPELPDPDTDVAAMVASWRARVVEGDLELADVTITKSITKDLDEYFHTSFTTEKCKTKTCSHVFDSIDKDGPDTCPGCGLKRTRRPVPPHVRLAVEMRDSGESPMVGDRIPYVQVYDVSTKSSVPVIASTPGVIERLDRGYYWTATYRPTASLLKYAYPDYTWPDPERDGNAIRRDFRIAENTRSISSQGIYSLGAAPKSTQWIRIRIGPGDDVDTIAGAVGALGGSHRVGIIICDETGAEVTRLDTDVYSDPILLEFEPGFSPVGEREFVYAG